MSALVLNLYAPVTVADGRWVARNHQGSLYSLVRVGGSVRRTEESAAHGEGEEVLAQIAALTESELRRVLGDKAFQQCRDGKLDLLPEVK